MADPFLGSPAGLGVPVRRSGGRARAATMSRTRSGLLDGAARAFAERGLRASTMESIARTAGVAKATLYNHFRTKDEVARTLLARELDRLADAAAGRLPEAALASLADELAGNPVLRRMRETDSAVLVDLLAVSPDRWAGLVARLAAALRVEPEDAEPIARWLLGVVLQPGRSALRRRDAVRLAALLPPPG